jgi:thioredoxin reductase
VILGGGDSALDWVLDLHGKASASCSSSPGVQAAPASVARTQARVGSLTYVEGTRPDCARRRMLGSRSTCRLTSVDFDTDHRGVFDSSGLIAGSI